jgi:menaquinone-dependent protoporphyrinogen oxidase
VYAGHWQKPATPLVDRVGSDMAGRPVRLFSSGPDGDPPKPEEDPVDVADLVAATNAREHRVFAGKLVRKQLSFPERAIVSALRVPEGDFRDWTEIRQWAAGIADALEAGASAEAGQDDHRAG